MISQEELLAKVIGHLENIYDPEIPVNIYALGLIYEIGFEQTEYGYNCHINMTLTSTGCPVSEVLLQQVYNISSLIDELDIMFVNLVFEPPWTQDMMSFEAKLELGLL